ncbi:sulfate transporter-like [Latimeria chalumnae]
MDMDFSDQLKVRSSLGSTQDSPPLYMQIKLEEHEKEPVNIKELMLKKIKKVSTCTPKRVVNLVVALFPVLKWLPQYKIKEYLLGDIMSGIILAIVVIPQSIAYALLANVDPIYGLYTNFFSVLIYFFMSTSHHNCVGAFGVLCLMIGESVNKHVQNAGYDTVDDAAVSLLSNTTLPSNGTLACDKSCYAIGVATALTFLVGIYQVAMGIFRLGFISVYLSEPLLSGFVTGASLTVLTSQVKYLFGLKIPRYTGAGSLALTWIDIFTHIKETNICDLITSIVALAVSVPVKEINDRFKSKLKAPIPIELLVVIGATIISHYFDFNGNYKSSISGSIPTGFLRPKSPDWSILPNVAADAVPIAIIGFATTISLAELFAKKHKYTIDANQEMIALGMCNVVPAFFYSFASSAALAKTLLKESTGAHTQLNGLVSCGVLLLVLLLLAPLFYSLQKCILAIVTIINLKGALRKFYDVPNMWRINKIDTIIWWVTMLASSLITTELGLLIGVCFSIFCVIFRTQRPRATLLAQVKNTEIYEDEFSYKKLNSIPNIKIFRFDTSLYYANKRYFKSMLYKKTGVNPTLLVAKQKKALKAQKNNENKSKFFSKHNISSNTTRSQKEVKEVDAPHVNMHFLIIDCGAMQFIDTVGLNVLKETLAEYREIHIDVLLANCNPSVRQLVQQSNYFGNDTDCLLFHSVHDAVQFAEWEHLKKQKEIHALSAVVPEEVELQTKM